MPFPHHKITSSNTSILTRGSSKQRNDIDSPYELSGGVRDNLTSSKPYVIEDKCNSTTTKKSVARIRNWKRTHPRQSLSSVTSIQNPYQVICEQALGKVAQTNSLHVPVQSPAIHISCWSELNNRFQRILTAISIVSGLQSALHSLQFRTAISGSMYSSILTSITQ